MGLWYNEISWKEKQQCKHEMKKNISLEKDLIYVKKRRNNMRNFDLSSDFLQIAFGLGLILVGFIVFLVIVELLELPQHKRNKHKMEYLSGRTEGKILTRSLVRDEYITGSGRNKEYNSSYRCMLTYEFEVDGISYTGKGEGAGAFWKKESQTICYDPNNPNDNCTLFFYNSKTDTNIVRTVFSFLGRLLIFFGIFYLILRLIAHLPL